MTKITLTKLTGVLLIVGSIIVNIPYTLLIMNFDYPDILREPVGYILTQFQQGRTGLILTWLSFAWTGIPLFFAIIMLQKVLEREDTPYLWVGTISGVVGAVTQMIGLLRWVFVVPILANLYTVSNTSEISREAIVSIFQVVHQYGGVVLGEHLGQTFTIMWMLIVSFAIFKSNIIKPWVAWLGIFSSLVYLSAQTELFHTVIPNFPVISESGLIGSLLWLFWMFIVGVHLVRAE